MAPGGDHLHVIPSLLPPVCEADGRRSGNTGSPGMLPEGLLGRQRGGLQCCRPLEVISSPFPTPSEQPGGGIVSGPVEKAGLEESRQPFPLDSQAAPHTVLTHCFHCGGNDLKLFSLKEKRFHMGVCVCMHTRPQCRFLVFILLDLKRHLTRFIKTSFSKRFLPLVS